MCSNTIRRAGCGQRGSGLDVCSAVYRYYFCTNARCLLPTLKGEGGFANWVMTQAFWLADWWTNHRKYYWVIRYLLVANTVTMVTVVLHVRLAMNYNRQENLGWKHHWPRPKCVEPRGSCFSLRRHIQTNDSTGHAVFSSPQHRLYLQQQ